MRFSKPKAILLDIEGTIVDSTFFSATLYPFLRNNVNRFLHATYDTVATDWLIKRIRQLKQSGTEKRIPSKTSANSRKVISRCSKRIMYLFENHSNSIELVELDLLVWIWAAENGLIATKIYPEVPRHMHKWKVKKNIRIFIYSSVMELVQKLLLCCTERGNLLSLIEGYFDNNIGDKYQSGSYEKIVDIINLEPRKVLFITDNLHEGNSAIDAGLKVAIVDRNKKRNNNKKSSRMGFVASFDEVKFKEEVKK